MIPMPEMLGGRKPSMARFKPRIADGSIPSHKLMTTSVLVQKFAKQVGRPHIVMAEKAGIQVGDFPGFRVALAIASLPGMTDESCSELLGRHTSGLRSV